MRPRPTLATLLLTTLLLAGCSSPPPPAPPPGNPPGLTARGIGTVNSTPDRLTVVLGVQNRGRAAQETLDANNRLATATIDALRAAGVADTDLRTSQLSVSPTLRARTWTRSSEAVASKSVPGATNQGDRR